MDEHERNVSELLSVACEIEELIPGADESAQRRWQELHEDVANLQRAIEMARYRGRDLVPTIDALLNDCRRFLERLRQEEGGKRSSRRPAARS